jgi:hypothetical protein
MAWHSTQFSMHFRISVVILLECGMITPFTRVFAIRIPASMEWTCEESAETAKDTAFHQLRQLSLQRIQTSDEDRFKAMLGNDGFDLVDHGVSRARPERFVHAKNRSRTIAHVSGPH